MYALVILMTTTEGTLQLLLPPYLDSHGYELSLIGVLVSTLSMSRLLSRLPAGAAYGPAKARRQLILALLGLSLATGGFFFADGRLLPVLALSFVHGFSFGALGTLVLASFIDLTGGRRAGATMAWYTAALSIGYSLGAFAGGALGDALGVPVALALVGVLPLVGIAVVLMLPAFHGPVGAEPRAAGMRALLSGIRHLDPRVWLAFTIVLYVNLLSDAVDAFFPLYGLAAGLALTEVGAMKGLKSASATAIRFASLGLMRFVDHRAVNLWGVVLKGLATLAIPFAPGVAALAGIFAILGFCRGILRVTSASEIAELRQQGKDVGLASGVYNAGLDVGAIIGPVVGGTVATAVGIPLMFQLVALASLLLYFAVALSTVAGREELRRGATSPRPGPPRPA